MEQCSTWNIFEDSIASHGSMQDFLKKVKDFLDLIQKILYNSPVN